jgi:AcrR family transcriptional regulator
MTTRTASMLQTRERILEAAMGLFRERHYDELTLREIADAAEVSLPTVLLHFKSKGGVLEAAVEWHGPREESLRDTPPGDFETAARVVVGRYEEMGRATLRLLALEERFPEVARLVAHGRKSHRAWVERTFAGEIATVRGAARERRILQLVTAYDVYAWEVLRRALSVDETILSISEMARAISRGAKA